MNRIPELEKLYEAVRRIKPPNPFPRLEPNTFHIFLLKKPFTNAHGILIDTVTGEYLLTHIGDRINFEWGIRTREGGWYTANELKEVIR